MLAIPTFDSNAIPMFLAAHYAADIRHKLLTTPFCENTLLHTSVNTGGGRARITLDEVLRAQVIEILRTEFDVKKELVELDVDGTELEEGDEYTSYSFSKKTPKS